jgi:hypothetical protein
MIKNLVSLFDEEAHEFALKHMENILGAIVLNEPMILEDF